MTVEAIETLVQTSKTLNEDAIIVPVIAHYIGNRIWFELKEGVLRTSVLLERLIRDNGTVLVPSPETENFYFRVDGVREVEYHENLQLPPKNYQGAIDDIFFNPNFID